ncbi:MAG: hypothetical protein KME49_19625 [Brasilonema octagenarum HA4186-MV1]|jgi:hypothetical protein|uniref:Uncharacterized protein n=2 Tax=Brasilonema TaxID=383614 RepID=A0A856MCW3_9CYAN|nr:MULTISPECIES: hypothetical protein [Brasilonema]MBW4627650.1 hypothetical protein [Brasilonema octagenarum HA4186-MV1]NMF61563.1 hypothetical protein [Brasilonema octagenarum UFV-OR1]QDL08174.1 hypothetical protein DP114_09900 [Brasilonema sennae CENA114]QDL14532.1 hypothetical protein DP113_09850 [Brasilonema octagenarum UFV-E1]
MTDQTLHPNQDIRKAEAKKLLEQANQQLGEALKSYQQAQELYQDVGEETVATLISYLISQSKILTVSSTDKSGNSKINLTAASGILANRSRIRRPK